MSIVVVAAGLAAGDVLGALAAVERVGGRWPAEVFDAGFGTVVVAGAPVARAGDWLVAGAPVRDPWGVPLPFAAGAGAGAARWAEEALAIATAFARYGPAAVQLAAGPFVAVDLGYGKVVRAVNGIVPLHASRLGRWVASTSAEVVAALGDGGRVEPVGPGESMSPAREVAACGPIAPDLAGCDFPWAWVDRAVAERVAGLGPLSPFPGAERDLWRTAHGHALYLPRTRARSGGRVLDRVQARARPRARGAGGGSDSLARYTDLRRDVLPRRWWTARLAGQWLFAPAFERPVLDTIAMLRHGPPAREGPAS